MASSSSSCSRKYDVFPSFSGENHSSVTSSRLSIANLSQHSETMESALSALSFYRRSENPSSRSSSSLRTTLHPHGS
ncbi:unnamed protein product [Brassica oleracea]